MHELPPDPSSGSQDGWLPALASLDACATGCDAEPFEKRSGAHARGLTDVLRQLRRAQGAQRFFKWYAETDESFASPMRRMRPPPLPDYPRLHLNRGTVRVFGKDRRKRIVSLDNNTVAALDDYMRARRGHPHADLPWLWLGKKGLLNDSGIGRALRDRGMRAGVPDLHRLGHGLWIVKPDIQRE